MLLVLPARSKDNHDISCCRRDRRAGHAPCRDCCALVARRSQRRGGSATRQAEGARCRFARSHAKPKAAADNGKCIGVVSAIGDTFSLQKIGITVFGNELNTVPIDSWQIDNLVIGKISAFLSKAWTVRRISYPKGAFSSLDERQHPLFYNYEEDLKGVVRRVTSSTKCDHYVVVVKRFQPVRRDQSISVRPRHR